MLRCNQHTLSGEVASRNGSSAPSEAETEEPPGELKIPASAMTDSRSPKRLPGSAERHLIPKRIRKKRYEYYILSKEIERDAQQIYCKTPLPEADILVF